MRFYSTDVGGSGLAGNDKGGGDGEQNADKSKDIEQSHLADYNAMHQRTLYYRIVLEIDRISVLTLIARWKHSCSSVCGWQLGGVVPASMSLKVTHTPLSSAQYTP